ncbi:hypothetical protein JZ751_014008 [Albula glossodonta]|uniref:Uncharacterized protein n=1 Tax=Albula glossodonta TaxID=121402 RepID=A0A8T2MMU6_9TELE|nr:hypothetical protein JZ751_014008 [Albula glossodonta]
MYGTTEDADDKLGAITGWWLPVWSTLQMLLKSAEGSSLSPFRCIGGGMKRKYAVSSTQRRSLQQHR